METGQLELTVAHNGCCEGLEVAVLSTDYCRHELNWMHKEKRSGAWKHDNNVATSLPKHAALASVREHWLSQWMSVTALLIANDMEHNAPTRAQPAGVMAHKFSSPGAGICQNSAVHCGLMCFIHLPSPSSHCSVPISLCVCMCVNVYTTPPPPSHCCCHSPCSQPY